MSEAKRNVATVRRPTKEPVMGPEHRTVYTNSSRVGFTPWDMRITYGQTIGGSDENTIIQDEVTLVMSPQHAKAVLKAWQGALAQYETMFGPIPEFDIAQLSATAPAPVAEGKPASTSKKRAARTH